MVGAALLHFIVVELRPLIGVVVSTMSIGGTMFKETYNSEVGCVCEPGCTMYQVFHQNSRLLQSALSTFSPTFNATSSCMSVEIPLKFNYAPWFYWSLLVAWLLVFSTCIVLFLVDAVKWRFSSVQSGAYFVFSMELEHRCSYKLMMRIYILCLFAGFIAASIVILIQSNWNYSLMWTVLQREILPFIILVLSSLHLLSPHNLKEFSAWNLGKLRQIRFRRSCCGVFFDSNDALYHRIGGKKWEKAFSLMCNVVVPQWSFKCGTWKIWEF